MAIDAFTVLEFVVASMFVGYYFGTGIFLCKENAVGKG